MHVFLNNIWINTLPAKEGKFSDIRSLSSPEITKLKNVWSRTPSLIPYSLLDITSIQRLYTGYIKSLSITAATLELSNILGVLTCNDDVS